MTEETVCIGLARVSSETQKIVSGTLKELKDIGKFIILFQILTVLSPTRLKKISNLRWRLLVLPTSEW